MNECLSYLFSRIIRQITSLTPGFWTFSLVNCCKFHEAKRIYVCFVLAIGDGRCGGDDRRIVCNSGGRVSNNNDARESESDVIV
jgi:hypothetical protein